MLGLPDRNGLLERTVSWARLGCAATLLLAGTGLLMAAAGDVGALPQAVVSPAPSERLLELHSLADLGRAPRFPRWLDAEPRTENGSPTADLRSRFGMLTVASPSDLTMLPPWVPDADRWVVLQERMLLGASCLCFNGAGPGAVPDGDAVPGVPLLVDKRPGQLRLDWSASCNSAAEDYGVYEGTIGTWYSHVAIQCSSSGALFTLIPLPAGNRYYLVVPLVTPAEGSYGTDSNGTEIPQATLACRASAVAEACP